MDAHVSTGSAHQTEDDTLGMGGQHKTIPVNDRVIIAIADPHLESVPDDVECMIRFVKGLNPADHVILFLGDLFHVWTESDKYHTPRQQRLLDELGNFRQKGGVVCLTVGNRDLFFSDKIYASPETGLPFDAVSLNYLSLRSRNDIILAHHGDTVNREDSGYRLLRRIVRSGLIKAIFNLVTAKLGKRLLYASEKNIKKTNQRFRVSFPERDWLQFVDEHRRRHAPSLLLVGHFHSRNPIITKQGSTTGIVVPPWHITKEHLVIDTQLRYHVNRFSDSG